ncbi:class I SAM-dependent methyltransferase [Caballeronia sp. Sq4a]|uniref:class I SAM-dependent methyltransferase n=1 Tax=Caballeronia sp. Sq4a TaxID=2878152 RepID=UPI0020BF3967|nr:class I SAM-dependent methyltransferase [Caballeronia sp. Sq4a]
MSPVNQDYWQSQVGTEYRRQQEWRSDLGNSNYREQEAWVVAHLQALSGKLGRPVDVLDFGCGFGRMARVLSQYPFVRYHGYDFSEAMARELIDTPPAGLDAAQAVRIAPTAAQAFAERRFDVVFTVSVLIHNAHDEAARILADMKSLLAPDGYLLLIENQLVPFEIKENNWHAGCWLHDYVGDLASDFNVDVIHGRIPNHDVYLLRPLADGERRVTLFDGDEAARPLSEDERLRLSVPRLKIALKGLESELEHRDFATVEARLHDFAEKNSIQAKTLEEQRRTIEEQQRALTEQSQKLNEQIEAHREAQRSLEKLTAECEALRSVQHLRKSLQQQLVRTQAESPAIHVVPDARDDSALKSFESAFPTERSFEWQSIRDTQYANADSRFDQVCHIFNVDWLGIRSAVGALPGWKLSVPSTRGIPVADIERIIALLQQHRIRKLVLHGISDPMYALSRALSRVGFDDQSLVWHGTTAQWVWDDERRFALQAIQMARNGEVRRFSAIRRGLGPVIGERNFAPQLVNMPPLFKEQSVARRVPRNDKCSVLAPSWNDLRKNLATNVLAAQCVDRVDQIYVVAKTFDLPKWLASKVTKLAYRDHSSMLEVMASMDVVLNVTTIDCHPMVDLESMSVGTPCVRGPLFLDGLEDHEYVRATAVDNPMSVEDVRQRIDRVLSTDHGEMQGMMSDYKSALLELSRQRYVEFLKL